MNIFEAATSGKAFTHPGMIGAFMMVDGLLVHRDNWRDFKNLDFIRTNVIGNEHPAFALNTIEGRRKYNTFHTFDLYDVVRTDWRTVDLEGE